MTTYKINKQFTHTVTQNTHYQSEREGWGHRHSEERLDRRDGNPEEHTASPLASCPVLGALVSKDLDASTPQALLPVTHICLLDWFQPLYAALIGRCLTLLASPTSWGHHHRLCLHSFSQWRLRARDRDTATCCLASAALLSFEGRIHNPLNYAFFLIPEAVLQG